jgi:uncharacterized protein (DUF2384 family)
MEILTFAAPERLRRFAPRMKRAHVAVTTARSPGEMSKHLRGGGRRPDLVLVDSRLPDVVAGGEVLQEIIAGAGGMAILIQDLERVTPEAVTAFLHRPARATAPTGTAARDLPTHAVSALHDPKSGRVDAREVAKFFGLSLTALAKALGRSPQSLHKTPDGSRVQRGLSPFVRIATSLLALFGSAEKARVWLNAPHPDLDQVTPIELVKGKKAAIVADLLEDALLGHPG